MELTTSIRRPVAQISVSTRPGIFARFRIARQRRQLGQLDAHLLKDIGLTDDAARAEARRPFWDAPDHWRV